MATCAALLAGLATFGAGAAPPAAEPGVTLSTLRDGGVEIDVVRVDLRRARLELLWEKAPGRPLGSLSAAWDHLVARGERPVALTNAGIYGRDDRPLGLHVEGGRTRHRLDLRRGGGNFYLRPGGVFFIDGAGARVMESRAFAAARPRGVRLATQSGPALVLDGRLHPRFDPRSTSALVRNGVGVGDRNEVVLAVSRGPITFHHFATFFRDRLGCRDALYLDGNISRLHAPALGRDATGWFRDGHFVGILAVLPGPARAGSTPPRPRPRSR